MYFCTMYTTLRLGGTLMDLSTPKVMGIVNVTPDSFYSGSRTETADAVRTRVVRMRAEGADILDIGGCSTRPGGDAVSADEEYSRLARGMEVIRREWPEAIVSADTYRAEVARRIHREYRIDIVNDISGTLACADLPGFAAEHGLPYVVMHMLGGVETMHTSTLPPEADADTVVSLVLEDLMRKADHLHSLGVADVILDPGFGFSKTMKQNFALMDGLEALTATGQPVLVGVSRKSMVYKTLGVAPAGALPGTTALHAIALAKGASILRVHDVAAARQAIVMTAESLAPFRASKNILRP